MSNLSSPSNPATGTSGSGEFHIWILNDDTAKFQEYITQFKEMYPSYKNKTVVVESFSNEKTYQNSLSSAIFLGQ